MKYLHVAVQILICAVVVMAGMSFSLHMLGRTDLDRFIWHGKFNDIISVPAMFGLIRYAVWFVRESLSLRFQLQAVLISFGSHSFFELSQYFDAPHGSFDVSDFLAYGAGALFCCLAIFIEWKAADKKEVIPISK